MPGTPPLVLVVDDTEDTRDALVRILSAAGWRTAAARTAEAGIDLARSRGPAAILLDFGLPGMDGWEATRRLKADPSTAAIPVVALTGHDTGEARDRALRAGVSGYLVKPCAPEDLVDELRRVIAPA